MKWSSFLSQSSSFEEAVREASQAVTGALHGASSGIGGAREVDFAAVFVSELWQPQYQHLEKLLEEYLSAKVWIGCSAGGVIGGAQEAEDRHAVSISAAILPGVKLYPFHLEGSQLPDLDASPTAWEKMLKIPAQEKPHFILLTDSFSFPADVLIEGLDYAYPKASKIGGVSSGASGPGESVLYLNGKSYTSGAVGVALSGNVIIDTVVAQGCRPIGNPLVITDCRDNLILELDHQPALEVLQEIFHELKEKDRKLVSNSLFLGVVMDPLKKEFNAGDFLIRNLIGADMKKKIIAVGAPIRVGQTVQFHLRDAETSAENLQLLLEQYRAFSEVAKPQGALLFSCQGRGEQLYGVPNHDSRHFIDTLGHVPLGGFFCNGEIGPVGGNTYLHGYTSCFGFFREASFS